MTTLQNKITIGISCIPEVPTSNSTLDDIKSLKPFEILMAASLNIFCRGFVEIFLLTLCNLLNITFIRKRCITKYSNYPRNIKIKDAYAYQDLFLFSHITPKEVKICVMELDELKGTSCEIPTYNLKLVSDTHCTKVVDCLIRLRTMVHSHRT